MQFPLHCIHTVCWRISVHFCLLLPVMNVSCEVQIKLLYTWRFIAYRTVNTSCFSYENKSVNVVCGSDHNWSIWCRSTDVTSDVLPFVGHTGQNYVRRSDNESMKPWKLSGYYMYRTMDTICTTSGNYMCRTVDTICAAQWTLYAPHSSYYVCHQFSIHKFYDLPTQCIYVFCVDLRTNSDYFPIQHWLTGFYNRDGVCLLRGTDWVFIYNSTFRPHSVFMCFVWIWEQTAIIPQYGINWRFLARSQNYENRLLAPSYLSVRPLGTQLPLDVFSLNLIFEDFLKICL